MLLFLQQFLLYYYTVRTVVVVLLSSLPFVPMQSFSSIRHVWIVVCVPLLHTVIDVIIYSWKSFFLCQVPTSSSSLFALLRRRRLGPSTATTGGVYRQSGANDIICDCASGSFFFNCWTNCKQKRYYYYYEYYCIILFSSGCMFALSMCLCVYAFFFVDLPVGVSFSNISRCL